MRAGPLTHIRRYIRSRGNLVYLVCFFSANSSRGLLFSFYLGVRVYFRASPAAHTDGIVVGEFNQKESNNVQY